MNAIAPMPAHSCATHNCAKEEKSEQKENRNCCHSEKKTCHTDDNNSDTQNPNSNSRCNCACCAVISIMLTYSQVSVAYLYLEKNYFIYKEEKQNNSPNHIWNPPKYN